MFIIIVIDGEREAITTIRTPATTRKDITGILYIM